MKNVTKKTIVLSLVLGSMIGMQTAQCLPSMSTMASSAASVAKENKWLLLSAAVAACGVAGLYAYFKLWQQKPLTHKEKMALRDEKNKVMREKQENQKYIIKILRGSLQKPILYNDKTVDSTTEITLAKLRDKHFKPKAGLRYILVSSENDANCERFVFQEDILATINELKDITRTFNLSIVVSNKDMQAIYKK